MIVAPENETDGAVDDTDDADHEGQEARGHGRAFEHAIDDLSERAGGVRRQDQEAYAGDEHGNGEKQTQDEGGRGGVAEFHFGDL